MLKVDPEDVAALLTKVSRGEIEAATSHDGGCLWTVAAGGYSIEIFDDAGEVDYVGRVTDPRGKIATFDQFMNTHGLDPVDLLAPEDRKKLAARMSGDRFDALRRKMQPDKSRR